MATVLCKNKIQMTFFSVKLNMVKTTLNDVHFFLIHRSAIPQDYNSTAQSDCR